jgi:L-lysine 2,3-aminomutase
VPDQHHRLADQLPAIEQLGDVRLAVRVVAGTPARVVEAVLDVHDDQRLT